MKILVTGGAGFIGSHVAETYLRDGHEVVIVDDLSTGSPLNVPPGASLITMDICEGDLEGVFARERPEVVNHHAAQMSVRRSVEAPDFDARVNILGSLRLLEVALRHRVRGVIFASTGGALYGEQDYFPADEEHPLRPVSPYGVAKASVEHYLFYYHAVHGLPSVALRYANVYGPRQNPEGEAGVVAIFCGRLLRGETPVINGDGKQTRDFVFVEDVAEANRLALGYLGGQGREDGFQALNIGLGREVSIHDLAETLARASGRRVKFAHGPARAGEQQRSCLESGRAKRVLGWAPAVSLEDGLGLTLDWFRERVKA
jgi:UDP-glucose 4-epimerase